MSKFKVTYFNVLANRRHVLIDDITEELADKAVAHFGDKSNPFDFLPEVRKETDQPATSNAK